MKHSLLIMLVSLIYANLQAQVTPFDFKLQVDASFLSATTGKEYVVYEEKNSSSTELYQKVLRSWQKILATNLQYEHKATRNQIEEVNAKQIIVYTYVFFNQAFGFLADYRVIYEFKEGKIKITPELISCKNGLDPKKDAVSSVKKLFVRKGKLKENNKFVMGIEDAINTNSACFINSGADEDW